MRGDWRTLHKVRRKERGEGKEGRGRMGGKDGREGGEGRRRGKEGRGRRGGSRNEICDVFSSLHTRHVGMAHKKIPMHVITVGGITSKLFKIVYQTRNRIQ